MASEFTRDPGTATELERRARDLMEHRASRTLDDAEWKRMRAKLMEFYAILRGWEEQANASGVKQQKS